MLDDENYASYSQQEIDIIMRLLDETIEEATVLRTTEAGPKPFDVAIELGAGSGRITPFIARRAGHVTAIEFVPEFSERNA